MSYLSIKIVNYTAASPAIQMIRHQVFEVEQGVDHQLEFDGQDEIAQHLLAYWNGKPVGTTRIRYLSSQIAKIERLAVLSELRGQGIGTKLMETALEIIQTKGVSKAVVHAQEYVKDLYLKLGFEPIGEQFDEANIPHLKMIHLNSNIFKSG